MTLYKDIILSSFCITGLGRYCSVHIVCCILLGEQDGFTNFIEGFELNVFVRDSSFCGMSQ